MAGRSMNKTLLIATGLLSFLACILIMAPAGAVLGLLADDLRKQAPDLAYGNITGSIWRGAADAQYGRLPPVRVSWRLSPLPLLLGRAEGRAAITGQGVALAFSGSLHRSGLELSGLNGLVESDYINRVSRDYGLEVSGRFTVRNLNLRFANGRFTRCNGALAWPGGPVRIQTPQRLYSVTLPPLAGRLATADAGVQVDIIGQGETLIRLRLKPSGWGEAAVNHAFMTLARLPLPGGGPAREDPALLVEEKLF